MTRKRTSAKGRQFLLYIIGKPVPSPDTEESWTVMLRDPRRPNEFYESSTFHHRSQLDATLRRDPGYLERFVLEAAEELGMRPTDRIVPLDVRDRTFHYGGRAFAINGAYVRTANEILGRTTTRR